VYIGDDAKEKISSDSWQVNAIEIIEVTFKLDLIYRKYSARTLVLRLYDTVRTIRIPLVPENATQQSHLRALNVYVSYITPSYEGSGHVKS